MRKSLLIAPIATCFLHRSWPFWAPGLRPWRSGFSPTIWRAQMRRWCGAQSLPSTMVAYVSIAPISRAFADRVNRRTLLVGLDVVRAGAALCLPFVAEVWQVYGLIFRAAIGLGRLYPDLPGHDPRRADGGGALHESAIPFAARLRSSYRQPHTRGTSARSDELQCPVPRDGRGRAARTAALAERETPNTSSTPMKT